MSPKVFLASLTIAFIAVCRGNGYCTNEFDRSLERVVGKCMCLDQYKYAQDCSEYACK